ncbi:MAG: phosphatase PAP2 family protein [Chitinophagaceae bacterium]
MMRKTLVTLVVCVLIVGKKSAFCQFSLVRDSLQSAAFPDTVPLKVNWNVPPKKEPLYKLLAIPGLMITYGVTSLKADMLKDVNKNVREEVAIEHPHQRVRVDDYLKWAPAVAVYGLNLVGIKGKNNFKDRTIIYGMSMILTNSVVFGTKKISGEERPDGSDRYSFPSGHTAVAFASAEFMRKEYQDVSPWYGIAGYAMAATTGYLRMYNDKHWLSDVVAGAGIGILSTDIAYRLYPTMKRLFSKKDQNLSTVVMPYYQSGSFGLGMVHHF